MWFFVNVLNKTNVGLLACRIWWSCCFRRSNWGSGQIRSKTSRGFAKRFGHSGAVGSLLFLALLVFVFSIFSLLSCVLCNFLMNELWIYLWVSVSYRVCCVHTCIIIKFSSQHRHGWIMNITYATNCVFCELYA